MIEIVIPALNEAERLPRTLAYVRDFVSGRPDLAGEVVLVVVDNGSSDETATIARCADSRDLPVRLMKCAERGKGAAVRAGIMTTTAGIVGYMDADGATDMRALPEGLRLLAAGADVAVGSRALPGSTAHVRHSPIRTVGAAVYRRLARIIVPGIADTQCGFKLIRGDIARATFPAVLCPGFSFDVELLGRAREMGARLVEYPVEWTDVPGSTFAPARHGLGAFLELAAIRRRLSGRDNVAVLPSFHALDTEGLTENALEA